MSDDDLRKRIRADLHAAMRTAADQLRAIADDAEAGRLTYDDLRTALFRVTWPVQQVNDPHGGMADFAIRGALIEAMERDDPDWHYHGQGERWCDWWIKGADPSTGDGDWVDNLGWALTRDGWYPPPHGLHQDEWNTGAWKPGDSAELPAFSDEQPEPYSTGRVEATD